MKQRDNFVGNVCDGDRSEVRDGPVRGEHKTFFVLMRP